MGFSYRGGEALRLERHPFQRGFHKGEVRLHELWDAGEDVDVLYAKAGEYVALFGEQLRAARKAGHDEDLGG